ncbi:hypothetical protein N431DRAFT_429846 [Stipitochalara longipes BDJ]|nr:hypothetical protein N431DRAFT_429846 [Stipitochalara longipes BDJ]
MTNFKVHIMSTGTPSRTASDPYTCYTAPYGAIGLASDLLSTYIYICLIGGRTPLYPKRTIRNRTMTFLLLFSSTGLCLVLNIAIAGQCGRPGAARQLVWVAIVKCILGPFWGIAVFNGAVQHLPPIQPKKCDGAAGNGEVGDTYIRAEEADLEAGGVETTRPGASRYQDASVQAGDGVTQWQELFELERLPSYSTIDPHVISSEEREIGIEPRYAAPEITTSSHLLTYTDENQECAHPASSHDQSTYVPAEVVAGKPKPSACSAQFSPEISYSHAAWASPALESLPEETPISAASQPLLPGSAEASDELGIIGGIVFLLILGGLLAWMLAAHISLAVQSVASGNSGARTVGFTFLAVFLAVVPTFLIISMSAWWKAAKTGRDVWKAFNILEVQGPLLIAPFISVFLLLLYGGMNLGVISGRVTGIVPSTTNTNEYWEYWAYLVFSKLPLFCF